MEKFVWYKLDGVFLSVFRCTYILFYVRSDKYDTDTFTASNHVIRNIYNTTKMSTKDSHFRRVWGKFIQISIDAYIVLLVR